MPRDARKWAERTRRSPLGAIWPLGESVAHGCSFTTERLEIDDWHAIAERYELDLVEAVTELLTATSTRHLPPSWHGDYDEERARQWIAERDAESPTLLVIELATSRPIGLMVLFEVAESDGLDLRIGYALGEAHWGRGFASELVSGLVNWARAEAGIYSLTGGVAAGNVASSRVLTKNGFTRIGGEDGEESFRLVTKPLD